MSFLQKVNMQPTYIVCGGMVTSKNDGDRHYISAIRLITLYRLPASANYIVAKDERDLHNLQLRYPQAFVLRPDPTGGYNLPGVFTRD